MHPRSEVAGRFWPDVLDSSARKSLRTELVAVRQALGAAGEGALVATREMVGLVGDAVFVDARRRRVALDPLREDAHRELIRRLIAAGEVSAARVAFDDLARRLRAELHVGPSRETRRLLDAIHAHGCVPAPVAAETLPPLPPALARRERSLFVGRDDSLGWLWAQLSDVRGGSGRLAVIAGDPGIGKTRRASEFARAAHDQGAVVFLGRCHEELLISYQPFVEAFGRYVAALSPEVLRGQLAPTGASSHGSFPSSPGDSRIFPIHSSGQQVRVFADVESVRQRAAGPVPHELRAELGVDDVLIGPRVLRLNKALEALPAVAGRFQRGHAGLQKQHRRAGDDVEGERRRGEVAAGAEPGLVLTRQAEQRSQVGELHVDLDAQQLADGRPATYLWVLGWGPASATP